MKDEAGGAAVALDIPPDYVDQLRAIYPKRAGDNGWMAVRTLIPRRVTEGHTWAQILAGTKNYAAHCARSAQVGSAFVKQAKTFYGPDCWFAEWADMDMRTPQEIAQDAKWAELETRAKAMGFTTVDRSRGYETAVNAVVQAERDAQQKLWRERGMDQPKFGRA